MKKFRISAMNSSIYDNETDRYYYTIEANNEKQAIKIFEKLYGKPRKEMIEEIWEV